MQIEPTGNFRDVPQGARPLAVSVKMACKLVGVGNTTMWALIKAGRVKTVSIGRRRLVIYSSLESLLADDVGVAS
jgi:excisionase family DNA binding protein